MYLLRSTGFRLLGLAVSLLLTAACSSTSSAEAVTPNALAGRWRIESLLTPGGDATAAPTMTEAFVQFEPAANTDGGTASGNAGVNQFNASWSISASMLVFEPPVVTRMAGPPEAMDFEHRLLQLLAEPLHPRLRGSSLLLRGAEGAVQLSR